MTKRYYLALDPDLAGDQGTLRGLTVARQILDRQTVPVPTARGWIRYESRLDADIRILTLPPGQDPDDLIRETPELWETLVEAAIPVVEYYFEVSARDLDLTTAKGKSEMTRRLAPILSEIRDEVERTHYIQKLARLIQVDESIARRQLGMRTRARGRRRATRETGQASEQPRVDAFALEEHCLAVLLRRPEFLERVNRLLDSLSLSPLREDDFERVENRALFAAWLQIEDGQNWDDWQEGVPEALQIHLDFLLAQGLDTDMLLGKDAERDIERRILELRLKSVERVIQNYRALLETMERGDAQEVKFRQMIAKLTLDRFPVEQALFERTSLGKREERERIV
jgi:DNA primase